MSTAGAFRGQFAAAFSSEIVIDLFIDREDFDWRPLSRCCVVFSQQNESKVFLATVKDCTKRFGSTRPILVLTRVSDIATGESRTAWRVPLRGYSGLDVRIIDENKKVWRPEAVDISLTGILIEFPKGGNPEFDVGASVSLGLKLDKRELKLPATVRRKNGKQYGLFFPYDLHGGEIKTSNRLRELVKGLERRWLSRHIR